MANRGSAGFSPSVKKAAKKAESKGPAAKKAAAKPAAAKKAPRPPRAPKRIEDRKGPDTLIHHKAKAPPPRKIAVIKVRWSKDGLNDAATEKWVRDAAAKVSGGKTEVVKDAAWLTLYRIA
jgi:hypothetical protein